MTTLDWFRTLLGCRVETVQQDRGSGPSNCSNGTVHQDRTQRDTVHPPRVRFGSTPALVVCSISETTVAAEGRRPAIRITYVKPGEKSPIKK
ncbi:MAG: hypothetical protein U0792_18405 [Gemmataceae bacterium]